MWLNEEVPKSSLVPIFSKVGLSRWSISWRYANLAVCRWRVCIKKLAIRLIKTLRW
jgi:hypothetical protein